MLIILFLNRVLFDCLFHRKISVVLMVISHKHVIFVLLYVLFLSEYSFFVALPFKLHPQTTGTIGLEPTQTAWTVHFYFAVCIPKFFQCTILLTSASVGVEPTPNLLRVNILLLYVFFYFINNFMREVGFEPTTFSL